MTVQKIQSGRVITQTAEEFVGSFGTLFYNEGLGDLRLGDGVTPGGRLLNLGGTGNSYPSFGTIRIADQLDLTAVGNDTLEFVAGNGMRITTSTTPNKTITFESTMIGITLDGGVPNSIYGGVTVLDGGGV